MSIHKLLAAIALVGLITPFALAQDSKKEERKTDSEKEGKAGESKGDAKGDKFDRGDDKAEKFLKKPYIRVYSAEEKGLKKLHAGADISVDASAFGFGALEFEGDMWWRTGGNAIWEAAEDDTEGANPLGNMSAVAKSLFEPYLGYVSGFESWDVRFKEASFKFGDPVMEGEGKEAKEVGKTVIVDYADDKRSDDTFTVRDNKVTNVAFDGEVQGQKSRVTFTYEYEDQGKQLRLSSVGADTEISVEGLPGTERDPKKPGAEGAAQKEKLQGKITVKKYGKVGDFEVALELEGELKMSMMGQELSFPTTLKLSDAKINDDVKDEDFPEEAGEAPTEDDEF